jgi:hypothetical protein
LNEGIDPFSIVIADHSMANGEDAYWYKMEASLDSDDLMPEKGVSLTDLKLVKNTNVVIPETPGLVIAMIKSFNVILVSSLED